MNTQTEQNLLSQNYPEIQLKVHKDSRVQLENIEIFKDYGLI